MISEFQKVLFETQKVLSEFQKVLSETQKLIASPVVVTGWMCGKVCLLRLDMGTKCVGVGVQLSAVCMHGGWGTVNCGWGTVFEPRNSDG